MKSILIVFAVISTYNVAQAAHYTCAGTEPFWSVEIDGQQIRYHTPESKMSLTITETKSAVSTPADVVTVIKTKNTSITIVRGADCTDGMSEEKYTHHAVYEIEGSVLYGCCNLK